MADVAENEKKKKISRSRNKGRQWKMGTFVEDEQLAAAYYRTRER